MRFGLGFSLLVALGFVLVHPSQGRPHISADDEPSQPLSKKDLTHMRKVTLVIDIQLNAPPIYSALHKQNVQPTVAWLHFGATTQDHSMRVDITHNFDYLNMVSGIIFMRAMDMNDGSNSPPIPRQAENGGFRRIFDLYRTTGLTNKDLMDPNTGKGIVYNTFFRDRRWRWEVPGMPHNVLFDDGNSFILSVLRHPSLFGADYKPPQALLSALTRGHAWNRLNPSRIPFIISGMMYEVAGTNGNAQPNRRLFQVDTDTSRAHLHEPVLLPEPPALNDQETDSLDLALSADSLDMAQAWDDLFKKPQPPAHVPTLVNGKPNGITRRLD